jgi:hypothetical protein
VKLELTKAERDRILAGDRAALKRDEDPGDVEGQTVPLRRRKAHKVPLYEDAKFSGQSRRIKGFQTVPEHWTMWVVLGKTIRHRKGHWQVDFTVHDERQASRTLRAGGPPGPPREPGLRTRKPEKPREKGEGVGSYTDETARGYGGGGDQALDYGGLEDDELQIIRKQADERWERHMSEERSDELARKRERAVRQQLRETLPALDPPAQVALLEGVKRLIAEAQMEEAA